MKYFPYADEEQKKIIGMIARNAADRLSDRFRFKIYDTGPENFYLSFSGGFESYLLYWFIRTSGMFADGYKIRIVSVVNSMFYTQIIQRIMD
ncbi:MAG: hypothetical protein K2P35_09095, partial [Lachnospiraceae bacterium]|nr:hypothetical protein [Lachnospiraceae bacterium]